MNMVNITDLKEKYKPIEKLSESVYIVRWNLHQVVDKVKNEETGEEKEVTSDVLASWTEEIVYGKPSIETIKQLITEWYNKQTDYNILIGFKWRGMEVWLSQENQFNYKAAYDLAIQTNGESFPVKFKFGTVDNPIYHSFTTLDELTDFYTKALRFVNDTLEEGWNKKDSIDYNVYKI